MQRSIFSVVLLLVASNALCLFYVLILTHIPEVMRLRKKLFSLGVALCFFMTLFKANSQPSPLNRNLET